MGDSADIPGWIALFMGLYSLAIALGEWRVPGTWQKMLDEISASRALMMAISYFETSVGAAIYLIIPWNSGDLVGSAMKIIGGLMVIEGLAVAAFSDRYIALLRRILAPVLRFWLMLTAVLGAALVASAIPRV